MSFLIEDRPDSIYKNEKIASARRLKLGGGAQFLAYLSSSYDTAKYVTHWKVKLEQEDANWSGIITSENPQQSLQARGLSGVFKVTVTAALFDTPIGIQLKPQEGSQSNVSCDSNCAAIIGIVAAPGGGNAKYWTVWNAFRHPERLIYHPEICG